MKTLIEFIRRDWQRTLKRQADRTKLFREYRRYRAKGFDRQSAKFMASMVL